MNRHSSFNEVFLTDARVPVGHVVGAVGDGWNVARTTLAHERSFATMRRPRYGEARRPTGRALREAEAEAEAHFATYVWYPQRAGRPDLLVPRARNTGARTDRTARDAVASVLSLQRASEWTAARSRAAQALGRPPGAEGSIGKLAASQVARHSAAVHTRLAGAAGMLAGEVPDDPDAAVVAEVLVSTPAQSIAGGTDEIQRNIVGEKILGLPREPRP